MRADQKKRLEILETASMDHIAQLDVIDYDWILDDYAKPEWVEIHHDNPIAIMRNADTLEIRGVYDDRRTDDEILAEGGKLEFL